MLVTREPTAVIAMGIGCGATFWITAPLTVIFARALAGLALLGNLTGAITMVHHVAGGLGAPVGARVFDLSGSYDGALWVLLLTSAVALVLVRWLPEVAPTRRCGTRPVFRRGD